MFNRPSKLYAKLVVLLILLTLVTLSQISFFGNQCLHPEVINSTRALHIVAHRFSAPVPTDSMNAREMKFKIVNHAHSYYKLRFAAVTRNAEQLAIHVFCEAADISKCQNTAIRFIDGDQPTCAPFHNIIHYSQTTFCKLPDIIKRQALATGVISLEILGEDGATVTDPVQFEHVNLVKVIGPLKHRIAMWTAVRDEARHLDEWIAYYRLMGVTHFRFYLVGTSDNTEELLSRYPEGLVQTIRWDYDINHTIQPTMMNHCLDSLRDFADYIFFADVDEFVWFRKDRYTLHDLLDDHMSDNKMAFYFRSMLFGTSHVLKQAELTISSFVRRRRFIEHMPPDGTDAVRVKVLVNTKTTNLLTVHNLITATYEGDPVKFFGVHNQKGLADVYMYVYGMYFLVDYEFARMNHYYTRSLEELHDRRGGGKNGWYYGDCYQKSQEQCAELFEYLNEEYDDSMKRYADMVLKQMNNKNVTLSVF